MNHEYKSTFTQAILAAQGVVQVNPVIPPSQRRDLPRPDVHGSGYKPVLRVHPRHAY